MCWIISGETELAPPLRHILLDVPTLLRQVSILDTGFSSLCPKHTPRTDRTVPGVT